MMVAKEVGAMEVDLKRLETNLGAVLNLNDLILKKRRALRLQVWRALKSRLPERTTIWSLTTIRHMLSGDGEIWDVEIMLPDVLPRHWEIWKTPWRKRSGGLSGIEPRPRELLFQLPCTTPVIEVVEATVTRITVDLLHSSRYDI